MKACLECYLSVGKMCCCFFFLSDSGNKNKSGFLNLEKNLGKNWERMHSIDMSVVTVS